MVGGFPALLDRAEAGQANRFDPCGRVRCGRTRSNQPGIGGPRRSLVDRRARGTRAGTGAAAPSGRYPGRTLARGHTRLARFPRCSGSCSAFGVPCLAVTQIGDSDEISPSQKGMTSLFCLLTTNFCLLLFFVIPRGARNLWYLLWPVAYGLCPMFCS